MCLCGVGYYDCYTSLPVTGTGGWPPPPRPTEEWMLICQRNADLQPSMDTQDGIDWTLAAHSYPTLEEAPSFISQQKQAAGQRVFTTSANPANLQGKQQQVYTIVQQHQSANSPAPLRMIVSGTAGTGKSYLIHCLRLLLQHQVLVAAPTGVAAFNIDGQTLHSLLPTRAEFKDLVGERLTKLQQAFSEVKYLVIDEMSMVGRKIFGQVYRRLRQAFPHHSQEVLGGCSCLLFGDFGQLPPVMDLPLYTTFNTFLATIISWIAPARQKCNASIYRPYVVVSMRMRYMCAFLFRRVSVYIHDLFYEYRRRLRRRRERERERRARESVHRRRLCDQESARLQRPPRKGRPARRRVRDRAI